MITLHLIIHLVELPMCFLLVEFRFYLIVFLRMVELMQLTHHVIDCNIKHITCQHSKLIICSRTAPTTTILAVYVQLDENHHLGLLCRILLSENILNSMQQVHNNIQDSFQVWEDILVISKEQRGICRVINHTMLQKFHPPIMNDIV